MKKVLLFAIFLNSFFQISANTPIEVADITLKIKKTEELYYAFAAGDKLIFSFKEVNNKPLSEIEILEFPDNSRFKDFSTSEIKEKTINVTTTGVYKFRLYNKAFIGSRICKVKIYRIPANTETNNFNTSVKWVERFDTSYSVENKKVLIRYDTIIKHKTRRVWYRNDTSVVPLVDRVERVSSTTKINGNPTTRVNFSVYDDYSNRYKQTEIIYWAYSIHVGESGKAWYNKANQNVGRFARAAKTLGALTSGYGSLIVLALEGHSAFSTPPKGDNIKFSFWANNTNFEFGNSVAASSRSSQHGSISLILKNDNIIDGINVEIKIIGIAVTRLYKDEPYTVTEIEPVKQKQDLKIPKVTMRKIPVVQK